MTVKSVTNVSLAPRGVNVVVPGKDAEGKDTKSVNQFTLIPGQTADLDLHDEGHPVFKGMVDSGDLLVMPEGERPDLTINRHAKTARDAADLRGRVTDLEAQIAVLTKERDDARQQLSNRK